MKGLCFCCGVEADAGCGAVDTGAEAGGKAATEAGAAECHETDAEGEAGTGTGIEAEVEAEVETGNERGSRARGTFCFGAHRPYQSSQVMASVSSIRRGNGTRFREERISCSLCDAFPLHLGHGNMTAEEDMRISQECVPFGGHGAKWSERPEGSTPGSPPLQFSNNFNGLRVFSPSNVLLSRRVPMSIISKHFAYTVLTVACNLNGLYI